MILTSGMGLTAVIQTTRVKYSFFLLKNIKRKFFGLEFSIFNFPQLLNYPGSSSPSSSGSSKENKEIISNPRTRRSEPFNINKGTNYSLRGLLFRIHLI